MLPLLTQFFIFLVTWICSIQASTKIPQNDSDIRNMMKDMLKEYDPRLRPNYLGEPVEVIVDATILSFTNLDAINMMYTVDMFFRQTWKDHRLKHSMNKTLTLIVGTKHPTDIIWTPDTVFINSVTSSMHHVTVNNHKLDISPDGNVFWGTRVTVSPSCYLDLHSYPMDVQNCKFDIVSYAYDASHLTYKWKQHPGIKITDRKMAQFQLVDFETVGKKEVYVAGSFFVLTGKFQFKRLMGFAVLQIYVPSIAIVAVSWISLWIRRNATPARVGLCITTLLTISTIWASVNATLPRVNYVKAIDIFLMTSFCCVICTLLEYTLVLNCGSILDLLRRNRKPDKHEDTFRLLSPHFANVNKNYPMINNRTTWSGFSSSGNHDNNVNNNNSNNNNGGDMSMRMRSGTLNKNEMARKKKEEEDLSKKHEEENERLADTIEVFARVFFPLIYMLFNVCYWTIYLHKDHQEEKSV
ncbi:gamma-aminobutyric acid receptor subunit beta-2-like [Clytia hemisphaerica]|uniref:Gamma-aminobutyric acid receptor subunit beta n=1 Tax=Clytia hemisphaerica TaxID=252671 RepID=A0A7M5VA02_9CNID